MQTKIKVKIRPMSINKSWQGRRFKTKEYKEWSKEISYLLKEQKIKKTTEAVEIKIDWYYKNAKRMDIDNPLKVFLDSLVQNNIIDDDRNIWKLTIEKHISQEAYFLFSIKEILIN